MHAAHVFQLFARQACACMFNGFGSRPLAPWGARSTPRLGRDRRKQKVRPQHVHSVASLRPHQLPRPVLHLPAFSYCSGHCIICISALGRTSKQRSSFLAPAELARIQQAVRLGPNPPITYKVHYKVSNSGFTDCGRLVHLPLTCLLFTVRQAIRRISEKSCTT